MHTMACIRSIGTDFYFAYARNKNREQQRDQSALFPIYMAEKRRKRNQLTLLI